MIIVSASRSQNKIKSYAAAFLRFELWSAHHRDLRAFRASTEAIALYILSLGQGGASSSTINHAHFAKVWLHKAAGFEIPTQDPVYKTLLDGVKRESRLTARQKHPLTADMTAHIRKVMIRDNGTILLPDYRLLLFIFLSYAGFLRFDEASKICR